MTQFLCDTNDFNDSQNGYIFIMLKDDAHQNHMV